MCSVEVDECFCARAIGRYSAFRANLIPVEIIHSGSIKIKFDLLILSLVLYLQSFKLRTGTEIMSSSKCRTPVTLHL